MNELISGKAMSFKEPEDYNNLRSTSELLKTEPKITIKEAALVLGINERTLSRWVMKIYPDIVQNGKTTYLSEYQITRIKEELSKNYSLDLDIADKVSTDIQIQEMTLKVIEYHQNKLRELTQKIKEDAPKVEFFEAVTGSKDCIDIGEAAKVLNIKNFGRNKLFEFLREQKVLNNKNQPMQKYIDIGYFRTIEQSYQTQDGATHINIKTVVYQSGLSYIKTLANRVGNICQ